MFELAIKRSPSRQRRAFLATRAIAPQALTREITRDLDNLSRGAALLPKGRLGLGILSALRAMWIEVVAFGVLSRLALLAAVWASSTILDEQGSFGIALAIAGGYLVFQYVAAATLYLSDVARGKLAHGVELYLTTLINRKLMRIDPARMGEF